MGDGSCMHALLRSVRKTSSGKDKIHTHITQKAKLLICVVCTWFKNLENCLFQKKNGRFSSLSPFPSSLAFFFCSDPTQLRHTIFLFQSLFNLAVIADRPFLSSIKAVDGNRDFSKAEGLDGNNPQSSSSLSPNKQEILALFKRIQSSISKGENVNSKKRVSKSAEDSNKPSSAESILEVLHQSRTQGKGKTVGRRGDKFAARQKDSFKKEEISELLSNVGLEKSRPPSSFTKRSPVPVVSGSIDGVQPKNETLPETPSVIIPSDEIELTNERLVTTEVDQDEEQSEKFEDMKLSQLKEVAKSKGIKGYSKLKKSELVELLIRSGIDASS